MWLQNWSVASFFWDPFMLSKHPAKFGVHRSCESGDIPFFICHVTTWSMCHVTLWVESPHLKSPPCYVWGSWALWKSRYNVFSFVTWPRYRSVTWHFLGGPLILCHYPAKLGIHRPCESGDITSFICHVTTWSICHVTFLVGSFHPKWPPC